MNIDDDLNILIALQCGPVLENVKIANLLNVKYEYQEDIQSIFCNKAVSLFIMGRTDSRIIYYVYYPDELRKYIFRQDNYEYLAELGYKKKNIEQMLSLCSYRYKKYLQKDSDFPHEIGAFLGYPVDDVRAFVENKGDNAIFTGYWKVYHNINEAMKSFSRYSEAVKHVLEQVKNGLQITDLDI